MKRTLILLTLLLSTLYSIAQQQTIVAFGGDFNSGFIQYVADLTGKEHPKICYVPTASADNADNIKLWESYCRRLSLQPYVLRVWVNSYDDLQSFEEQLLDMDAIYVGGGNTLNMLGIWNYQGIDEVMKKALKKGIVLAGGSAGSICWFQRGSTDSRPGSLSLMDGLAFLPYSHCPHYNNPIRQEHYRTHIADKSLKGGYACDDRSGICFRNGKVAEVVRLDDDNRSYYVSLKGGKVVTDTLPSRLLLDKGALEADEYQVAEVNKMVKDFASLQTQETPLRAFVSLKYLFIEGKQSALKSVSASVIRDRIELSDALPTPEKRETMLNTYIYKVLVYGDFAAVVNKYADFYSLWYFVREEGKWLSRGEDIGGDNLSAAEITFREKAKAMK
jgi:peptidase E